MHESESRRQKLDACVARIARAEGVPPFRQHADEVVARTLDLEGGSSAALARVVLKDLGLTAQLLRAANSALYNHSGRPILSVPHGIVLLGWDSLRNLVSTIRYIEHFAHRSAGLRELMLLSLLSAVHSREMAAATGYPRPEEAHICGLFRNLGEVLIACHYPEEYAEIVAIMHAENIVGRAACLRVLDFSWDDVGLRVAGGWNMPAKVYVCLRGLGGLIGSAEDRSLASITDYARDLTHALYRDGADADGARLPWIVDIRGRRALIAPGEVRRAAEAAVKETEATFAALGIPSRQLRLERQAERARQLRGAPPAFDAAGLEALERAVEDAGRALDRDDFELTSVIGGLLDAVHGAGFDRAVFGLLNDEQTAIRGRLASGGMGDSVLQRFDFPTDQLDGPIRAALQRQVDVLIDCARDGRYDRSTLVTALGPSAFALFPVVVDTKPVGCLYADRQSAAPDLDAARAPLERVRDTVASAIRKRSLGGGARAQENSA
ncbi:MAG: HDOD domain-containing protein [Bryobacteraceae bacterium]|jgi:HD-like signal output (HDOD) protein